jgi:transcriptional regulator with XRE-family HTH domain
MRGEEDLEIVVRWEAHRAALRARRIELGLSQAEVSERMGMGEHYVGKLENEARDGRIPNLVTVWRWEDALKTDRPESEEQAARRVTVRDSAQQVRIALCQALAGLEQVQDAAGGADETARLKAILTSPEVTEALRTVVTKSGAVLARAIEECRELLT